MAAVVEIWERGWREAHLGRVPDDLVAARTTAYFKTHAKRYVNRTTVGVRSCVVAGFVMVRTDELTQLYVDPSHRGSPIAANLLGEAERQIRCGGHERAWLAVVPENGRARRFYERHDWVDTGRFDHLAPSRISVAAHRYVKRLQ